MNTAAQFSGEAEFLFQGSAYRLTIDNMALLEAEGALNQSMLDWAPQLALALQTGQNPQLRHMCALVYGGLKVNHPDITQAFVVDLAMGKHGVEARQALFGAVIDALQGLDVPEIDEGELGNAPAPVGNRQQRRVQQAGTGTKSSGSGAKPASKPKRSGGKPRGARS